MCRTTHVLFHQTHAGAGFQIQATGIKTHTLANECQQWVFWLTPLHLQ